MGKVWSTIVGKGNAAQGLDPAAASESEEPQAGATGRLPAATSKAGMVRVTPAEDKGVGKGSAKDQGEGEGAQEEVVTHWADDEAFAWVHELFRSPALAGPSGQTGRHARVRF